MCVCVCVCVCACVCVCVLHGCRKHYILQKDGPYRTHGTVPSDRLSTGLILLLEDCRTAHTHVHTHTHTHIHTHTCVAGMSQPHEPSSIIIGGVRDCRGGAIGGNW